MVATTSVGRTGMITKKAIFRETWNNLFKQPLSETIGQNREQRMERQVQIAESWDARMAKAIANPKTRIGVVIWFPIVSMKWLAAAELASKLGNGIKANMYMEKSTKVFAAYLELKKEAEKNEA